MQLSYHNKKMARPKGTKNADGHKAGRPMGTTKAPTETLRWRFPKGTRTAIEQAAKAEGLKPSAAVAARFGVTNAADETRER
jgi:hypothetical protein